MSSLGMCRTAATAAATSSRFAPSSAIRSMRSSVLSNSSYARPSWTQALDKGHPPLPEPLRQQLLVDDPRDLRRGGDEVLGHRTTHVDVAVAAVEGDGLVGTGQLDRELVRLVQVLGDVG